jgi:hypothetical protein
VAAEAGPTGRPDARSGPSGGFCARRGTMDLAGQADSESSGGIFVETHGQTGQRPQGLEAGGCEAPPYREQAGSGPGMREGSRTACDGAVKVDIGVLLELAYRAGVQLEDVVAMTGAQLTSGLLPAGILPSVGPAPGVAILDSPSTTAVSAQAFGMGVLPAQQSGGGEEDGSWDMTWEEEIRTAHGASNFPTMTMTGDRRGEPKGAGDRGREGAARSAWEEQTGDAAHKVESGALSGGVLSLSDRRCTQSPGVRVAGVGSVGAQRT